MKIKLVALLAMALAMLAQPAAAAVMLATYTGTVIDTGGPLDGKSFTATYRYDTNVGNYIAGSTTGVGGGTTYGPTSPLPVLWLTMEIDGEPDYNVDLRPLNYMGVASDSSGPGYFYSEVQHDAADPFGWTTVAIIRLEGIARTGADIETPFAGPIDDVMNRSYFTYRYREPDGTTVDALDVQLNPTWVTVQALAVPEPGTWAMMILGFGMVGGTMRRRQHGNLAAA